MAWYNPSHLTTPLLWSTDSSECLPSLDNGTERTGCLQHTSYVHSILPLDDDISIFMSTYNMAAMINKAFNISTSWAKVWVYSCRLLRWFKCNLNLFGFSSSSSFFLYLTHAPQPQTASPLWPHLCIFSQCSWTKILTDRTVSVSDCSS